MLLNFEMTATQEKPGEALVPLSLLEKLKGPEIVARFQSYCGITRKEKLELDDGVDADMSGKKSSEIVIKRRWLHWLFLFGTSLGDEFFYSIFFTFWFWNVDGAVGRRVVLVWAFCMYIGQSLKDIIQWPRPASPPVIKLEEKWNLEYGMPSTHAIVGSAVPLAIIFFTSSRYVYPVWIGVLIAATLCTTVCLSRVYLGMHSVLDIIAGLTLVAVLLPLVIPLVDAVDTFFLKHEVGGVCLMACGVLLCLCYPSGDRWTPARGDTFVILGSAVGLNLGGWMNYQLGIIRGPPAANPPYPVIWPGSTMILQTVIRQCLGLILVIISKTTTKKLIAYGRTKLQLKDERLGNNNTGISTELVTKYFTYTVVGFTVTHIIPNVFRSLGIQRPMFHTEI